MEKRFGAHQDLGGDGSGDAVPLNRSTDEYAELYEKFFPMAVFVERSLGLATMPDVRMRQSPAEIMRECLACVKIELICDQTGNERRDDVRTNYY